MHDASELSALVHRLSGVAGTPRELEGGQTLFRAGAPVRAMFVVAAGEIRLVRHPELGRAMTLQVARQGDLVAEASLFSERYHCDALAVTGARLLGFPVEQVREGLEADAGAAAALTAHLAHQVQRLRARSALLTIRSARERVLAYLDMLPGARDGLVDPGHPWTLVASEIGLSHEAVYRVLAALERDRRIARQGRSVRLLA